MITLNASGDTLQFKVSGMLDFNISREMLRKYKIHTQQNKVSKMEVHLTQVTACSSSAIGALILLADKTAGELMVSLDQCNDEVHQLFDSGFLDRFLKIQHKSRSFYATAPGASAPLLAH